VVIVTGFVEWQLVADYIHKYSFLINNRVYLSVSPQSADTSNFAICVEKIIQSPKYIFSSNKSFQNNVGCIRKGDMFAI
jgi:hypothetical protein